MNAIDLGLPSGALWAEMNLGANTVSDPGNYYAWGEAEPKEMYSPSTHSLYRAVEVEDELQPQAEIGEDGEETTRTTHTVMQWVDEPQNPCIELGEGWVTPSAEDFQELLANTTQSIVKEKRMSCLKCENEEGTYILLPLAGYKDDATEVHFDLPTGEYWTTDEFETTIEEGGYAVRLCIGSEGVCNLYEQHKSLGLSIRPILKIK